MKWCLHRLLVSAFAFVLVLGAASTALAQSSVAGGEKADPIPVDPAKALAAQAAQRAIVPSAYGTTAYSLLQIPAAAFQPRRGGASASPALYQTDTSAGTIWMTNNGGTSDSMMWAPVYLPEAALVYYMDIYACDSNTSGPHLQVWLTGFPGEGAGTNNDLIFFPTTGNVTTPCNYFIAGPFPSSLQINNNVEYNSGFHYVVQARFNALDGTNKLKGVDFWWKRQVSPAPLTATFPDVPVGSIYHRYVEALYSSGITAGCTGGNYCPNTAVTRGQMAVFLSLALGLNWPL